MQPVIYIITRCRNLENIKSSHLVFDTIRIGYPTFSIKCIYVGDHIEASTIIEQKCRDNGIEFDDRSCEHDTTYEYIVTSIFDEAEQDFILCDSDMVFHANLEWFKPKSYLTGSFIPTHYNEFLGAYLQEHLHTSLLYVSFITELKEVLKSKFKQQLGGLYTPLDYIKPFVAFNQGEPVVYDTLTNIYQCVGGTAFKEDVLKCYTHLFCGSYKEHIKDIKQLEPILKLHKEYNL